MFYFITIETAIFNHFFFNEFEFDNRIAQTNVEINNRIDAFEINFNAKMLEIRKLFRNLVSMIIFFDALNLINAILYRIVLISISSTIHHLFVVFLFCLSVCKNFSFCHILLTNVFAKLKTIYE